MDTRLTGTNPLRAWSPATPASRQPTPQAAGTNGSVTETTPSTPVTYARADISANELLFGNPAGRGTYSADSRSNLEGGNGFFSSFFRPVTQSNPTPIAGGRSEDAGENLRGISNNQANRAIRERFSEPGAQQAVMAAVEQLRDQMGSGRNRELNAYLAAMMDPNNNSMNDEQILQALNQVSQMMGSTYHEALPNQEVALSALHDIAMPGNISQANVGACVAGSAQMQMAVSDPLQYLSMVDSLAQGQPFETNGITLQPNMTFLDETGGNYRTPSTALVQNAIMDHVDGDREYTSGRVDISGMSEDEMDRRGIVPDPNNPGGNLGIMGTQPGPEQMTRLGNILQGFGRPPLNYQRTADDPASAAALLNQLAQAEPPASPSNPILVNMRWSQQGEVGGHYHHAVNIIGIENGEVRLMNPWGREDIIPLAELQARMTGILLPEPPR